MPLPKYKFVMLETPFCSGLAEMEAQVTRLVNDAIKAEDAYGYVFDHMDIFEKIGDGIWHIACHFYSSEDNSKGKGKE